MMVLPFSMEPPRANCIISYPPVAHVCVFVVYGCFAVGVDISFLSLFATYTIWGVFASLCSAATSLVLVVGCVMYGDDISKFHKYLNVCEIGVCVGAILCPVTTALDKDVLPPIALLLLWVSYVLQLIAVGIARIILNVTIRIAHADTIIPQPPRKEISETRVDVVQSN
jgi:hypothetical protein